MRCFCDTEGFHLKVEGDVGAEAIWCDECYSNLELDDFPLSKILKVKLKNWVQAYGNWMDWNKDVLLPNGIQLEDTHNEVGQLLTKEVQKEIGTEYTVRFSPSTSARMYARFEL
ncbi:hypothetical protein ACXYMX_09000 [Sporosarcina sp. CAU 1771]